MRVQLFLVRVDGFKSFRITQW